MDLLTRLAHARALERLDTGAVGEAFGSVDRPAPVTPTAARVPEAGASFERREVVVPLAVAPRVPRGFAERLATDLATDRPAMLGGCLDRLVLPTSSALARDLVCLGAARGGRPVFIDTETTGLGGVALPFMVGIAWYGPGSLTVTQWTLSRLGGEAALLADVLATLRNLGPDPLVSFNGASFDLPLLRVRARRHGLCERVLAARQVDHLDLLVPARRLHSGFGPDCRLGTLERDLLGLRRRGDIDSAEIPAVYWRWLQAPDDLHAQRRLQAVRDHNVVDLASLPALAATLARTIREPEGLERARRAARHFAKLGAHDQARLSLARFVEPGLARAQQGQALAKGWREAALELAELERRGGTRERAAVLWRAAWRQEPSCPVSSEAWAKHLEHHARDFGEALRVARASRLACPRRIARLERKLAGVHAAAGADRVAPERATCSKPAPIPEPAPISELPELATLPQPAEPAELLEPAEPAEPLGAPRSPARVEPRPEPRLAHSPRTARSTLLSVAEDGSGARRRYRLLR
ncbi:ribonuclease H-like domain-containing protein [Enhygromyxa salina]|uniref:YprB ribonuclease H-like domain-containing protein n=1 Tax=Enhygromyxa salina TaxID=215803 RepID=A0A2S9YRU1_9BACT|nr:ribonuclease H-like domain-containing protein [Enhygromyxa salina]PRQ07815.1 hypothetical protein ENSA7_24870 [Enhygromyxa salina]